MWNYQHLEVFETIIRLGSFQYAAKALHITQSAVSQRLKVLEDEVGVRLLIREQPIRPTSYGEQLLKHVALVKNLENDLELNVSKTKRDEYKTLLIGVNGDSLATWFLDAVKEVVKKENFLMHTIIENEDLTFSRLRKGEVVGCVSSRSKQLPGCDVEKLGVINYRLACIKEFKDKHFKNGLSLEALANAPAMIYDNYDYMHSLFLEKNLKLKNINFPHHLIGNSHAFLNLVLKGMSYGMIPEIQAKEYFKDGTLIDLIPKKVWKQELFWHHQRGLDKSLKKFSNALVKNGKALLRKV